MDNPIKIIRRVFKDDIIVSIDSKECTNMLKAADTLDKMHKLDLGHYQRYITKHSDKVKNFDDGYYYGISYYVVINDYMVECKILGAEELNDSQIFV